jgi:ribosomal protein S26
MIAKLVDVLFGCWHSRYSFPITVPRTSRNRVKAAQLTGTYVVCLDCGKELSYDWKAMKVISEHAAVRAQVATLAAKEAA